MHDEIEGLIGKDREIAHVTAHGLEVESFTFCDPGVEAELFLGEVEAGHEGACRSEEGRLLTAG